MKPARDLSTPALARAYRMALWRLHYERWWLGNSPLPYQGKEINTRFDRASECRDELNRRGWNVP